MITIFLLLLLVVVLLLVAAASSATVQHLELRPTAALVEERRQRRRLGNTNDTWEPPSEWFHPYSNAVYATLQHNTNTNGDPNNSIYNNAYQEFQKFRHLSRYEKHLRRKLNHLLPNDDSNSTGNYTTRTD
jgi:hypothetical protein